MTRKLATPDGREWQVHVSSRFVPPWRSASTEPNESTESELSYVQRSLIAILIGAIIVPLIIWIVELPIRLLVSPLIRNRKVTATTKHPKRQSVSWKTRQPDDATLAAELAQNAPPLPPPDPGTAVASG